MNHSIEFGRSSWAGAQWGNTSLGSSGFSTAARSTLSSSFTPNQGPSVWVTTNQRTYKSEPVMARARELDLEKKEIHREIEFQKRLAAIGRGDYSTQI